MKRALVLIQFFLLTVINAQELPVYIKPFAPAFVRAGQPFQVSCLPKLVASDSQKIDLFVLAGDALELTQVRILTDSTGFSPEFENVFLPDYFGKAYKINLNEYADSLFLNSSAELICNFLPDRNISSASIIFGTYSYDKADSNHSDSDMPLFASLYKFPSKPIIFYESQPLSGNALQIGEGGSLTFIPSEKTEITNLFVEFWGRIDSCSHNFFSLINDADNDTLLSLGTQIFNFLIPHSHESLFFFEDHFINRSGWDYFAVMFSSEERRITLYVNDNKIAEIDFNMELVSNNLKIEFDGQPEGISLDKLFIWDFKNNITTALNNKNYIHYSADSSTALYSQTFDFDELQENSFESSNFSIKYNNVKLIKSDAPIYSRAPELNVVVYQNFYSIEWEGKDTQFIKGFAVEKSEQGQTYSEIFYTDAEPDDEQKYYYSDPKDKTTEVIYYRVKQINNDGTEVYSPRVKIGQGEKEYFALEQNHPNPFNPVTYFNIEIFEEVEIEVSVYNIVGKKVTSVYEGPLAEGLHTFSFDGTELPSGIYFYEAKSPFSSQVKKMILAK